MQAIIGGPRSETLVFLHDRLSTHFAELRAQRAGVGGAPIFALEHGMPADQLALVRTEVCAAVRRGNLPDDLWLPFVVYAAEIGYEYSGDEYWQTFEARTPFWTEHGDRHYIRDKFVQFARTYQGARPVGPWAAHFTIISWPITHAILPTDLQRNLARVLFEYRRALTGELLANPPELGKRLAARAVHTSSRFQNFAQNTALLGQVAVALLLGEEAGSPYLLPATLQRIVEGLAKERDAWRQFREARVSADQIRIRGFHRPDTSGTPGARHDMGRAADPSVFLRDESGWTAYIKLPDITPLAERLPAVHAEAGRMRVLVAGYDGPPLASGQLLYPGRNVKLSRWPPAGLPLIQLETGSNAVNTLLADQCVLTPGPVWVFRRQEHGSADEVRSRMLRRGQSYVLLAVEPLDGLPEWIRPVDCRTAEIYAYAADPPAAATPADLGEFPALSLGLVADIAIRPAAVPPASWDGEGSAEWVAGDTPVLAISSSQAVAHCVLTLDGEPILIDWPETDRELFFRLTDLAVGLHQLGVSLVAAGNEEPAAQGSFEVVMRAPPVRPSTGTFAEGMVMLPSPVQPTLSELWDGKATLQILGPKNVGATLEVSLEDQSRTVVAYRRSEVALPLRGAQWAEVAAQLRADSEFTRFYDVSEACLVRVVHSQLGAVTLRCEREFAPLRWVAGRDAGGPYLRLVNNSEGSVRVRIQEFASPDIAIDARVDERSELRWPAGGLASAASETFVTSMIVPPHIRTAADISRLDVQSISPHTRSLGDVLGLVELATVWDRASLPADPYAATGRIRVLQAITSRIAALIGGGRWAELEGRPGGFDELHFSEIERAMGDESLHAVVARAILRDVDRMIRVPPRARARLLGQVIDTHAPIIGFQGGPLTLAEFALRLASDPVSLPSAAPGHLRRGIEFLLASPMVLRAARFAVLETHAFDDRESGSPYRGWLWD